MNKLATIHLMRKRAAGEPSMATNVAGAGLPGLAHKAYQVNRSAFNFAKKKVLPPVGRWARKTFRTPEPVNIPLPVQPARGFDVRSASRNKLATYSVKGNNRR